MPINTMYLKNVLDDIGPNIALIELRNPNSDVREVCLHDQCAKYSPKKELMHMKENAVLVNTSRGGLIDEETLYRFLKERKIAGAAIDVVENEPDVGKLKELDNIILTPHIATYTIETRKDMEIEATKNLIDGLREIKSI